MMMFSNPEISGSIPTPRSNTGATRPVTEATPRVGSYIPDSSRSRVDFPAPLCPTSPTRSPSSSDIVMSRNASMTTTLDSLRPMAPPALPRNVFFSDRVFASKIGNSTHALWVDMCGCKGRVTGSLQILTGPRLRSAARDAHAGRQCALPHLLQLLTGRHLLGEQRGLDAVEQALQPADQLGLRDTQFGVRRNAFLRERQREPLELLTQFRRQAVLELANAGAVDFAQPVAAGVVKRCGAHFLQQLLDHGADSNELRRLLVQIGKRLTGVLFGQHAWLASVDFDII